MNQFPLSFLWSLFAVVRRIDARRLHGEREEEGGCDNTLEERKYGCYYLDNEPVNKGYISFTDG